MSRLIRRELRFSQSPETVWRALTNSDALAKWMHPNDFEARVSHQFTFRVPPKPQLPNGLIVHCEVLKCEPPKELVFTWIVGDFLDTRVSYRLEAVDGGTRVLFEHSGFKREQACKGAEYGWKTMHGQLAAVLERTGKQR